MVIIEDKNDFSKKFYNKLRDYNKYKKEMFPLETIKLKDAIKLVN